MRVSSLCSAQLNRPWEINSNCGGAGEREGEGEGVSAASLANGPSDALLAGYGDAAPVNLVTIILPIKSTAPS